MGMLYREAGRVAIVRVSFARTTVRFAHPQKSLAPLSRWISRWSPALVDVVSSRARFTRETEAMCGRYTLMKSPDVLRLQFGVEEVPPLNPRFNIAPTQQVAAVRQPTESVQRT